jgi:hypothetical protein
LTPPLDNQAPLSPSAAAPPTIPREAHMYDDTYNDPDGTVGLHGTLYITRSDLWKLTRHLQMRIATIKAGIDEPTPSDTIAFMLVQANDLLDVTGPRPA